MQKTSTSPSGKARSLLKRKLIQVTAALLMNANLPGFLSGRIYRGDLKQLCLPGLNCYSCPGALGACPIGSLQALAANPATVLSFYVYGFLVLVGVLSGRLVCGFLCPFGLVQELLHKIPLRKWRHKRAFRWLRFGKYVVLSVFVIGIPTALMVNGAVSFPAFCEYICPVGTLEAGIPLALANDSIREGLGWLFVWKMTVLISVLVLCVKVFRPFCRFLCPLGALYSLFNRISLLNIQHDASRCTDCGTCRKSCPMEAWSADSTECIRCGRCVAGCPSKALHWSAARHRPPLPENSVREQLKTD
ncbi:MAG: 4Fe-4S binding protein [Coriobacteriaceae bacterium]|jgi:polyferredoxin|nr:4Fe-4S binding protein [Coriobacteriaceae bacterium]